MMHEGLNFDEINFKKGLRGVRKSVFKKKYACAGWANKKPLRIGWGWGKARI